MPPRTQRHVQMVEDIPDDLDHTNTPPPNTSEEPSNTDGDRLANLEQQLASLLARTNTLEDENQQLRQQLATQPNSDQSGDAVDDIDDYAIHRPERELTAMTNTTTTTAH